MHKKNFSIQEELGAAIWLTKNTAMRPVDIAFLLPKVHEFQVILIKSGTCNLDIEEINPIDLGLLASETIKTIVDRYSKKPAPRKVKRYIPKTFRTQIPGVIKWLYENYPSIPVREIAYSLGITPKRVKDVQKSEEVEPVHPVRCEVLNQTALEELIEHA